MQRNKAFENAPQPLAIPTYDGSGQCVHPDVLSIDRAFYRFKYLMVMEPYPFADDRFENPSLVCSNDGVRWSVPAGVENPLVPIPAAGWNSDADLLNDRYERLLLYYRYNSGEGETTLFSKHTEDGICWSEPESLFTVPVSGSFASPAFTRQDGFINMFYVDTLACSVKLMTSSAGLKWTEGKTIFRFPNAWHIDALYLDGFFYLLLNDKRSLFLLRSGDLSSWSVYDKTRSTYCTGNVDGREPPPALVSPSDSGWDNELIYRGTLLVQDGLVKVWYSAKSKENVWKVGYTSGPLPE
jgi:hypothetical protein